MILDTDPKKDSDSNSRERSFLLSFIFNFWNVKAAVMKYANKNTKASVILKS